MMRGTPCVFGQLDDPVEDRLGSSIVRLLEHETYNVGLRDDIGLHDSKCCRGLQGSVICHGLLDVIVVERFGDRRSCGLPTSSLDRNSYAGRS